LNVDEARMLALAALYEREGAHDTFTEVSAQAAKRPSRTDWTFLFKDTRDYGLPQGEPRVSVEIAGNQVVDTFKYVYVPEEWSRNERARRNLPSILGIVCTIGIIAVVAASAVIGVVHWSRKLSFSPRVFFGIFGAVFLLGAVSVINGWPVIASQASTAQPLELQLVIGIVTSLVFGIFTAAGLGLAAGLVASDARVSANLPGGNGLLIGVSAGMVIAGAGALARYVAPSASPQWGNLGPAS